MVVGVKICVSIIIDFFFFYIWFGGRAGGGREGEEERRKKGCANPVLFKAVLWTEIAVVNAELQAGRTLQSSLVLAVYPQTRLLRWRFGHGDDDGWISRITCSRRGCWRKDRIDDSPISRVSKEEEEEASGLATTEVSSEYIDVGSKAEEDEDGRRIRKVS